MFKRSGAGEADVLQRRFHRFACREEEGRNGGAEGFASSLLPLFIAPRFHSAQVLRPAPTKRQGVTAMSHGTGTVQTLTPAINLGPNTGAPASSGSTWALDFAPSPAPMGTKFVLLHFQNVSLPGGSRLEVDLGYDTDVFTAADGDQFWTRPVNVYVLAGGNVPIRYVKVGAGSGGVQLDR